MSVVAYSARLRARAVFGGQCSRVAEPRSDYGAVVELDAAELHRRMVGLQRLENRVRLRFLQTLAVFDAGERYTELGFACSKHYLVSALGMSSTNAFVFVQTARKLSELPKLTEAFGQSELSWSDVREIGRVATVDSEAQWLEFAQQHSHEEIVHEVKTARSDGRVEPKLSSEYGLKNLRTTIRFDVTLEEKERIETALRGVAAAMGEGAPQDVASVMLFWAQQQLEGNHSVNEASPSVNDGRFRVLYQQCPACTRSSVHTVAGTVEVEAGVVDRVASFAEVVRVEAEQAPVNEDRSSGNDRQKDPQKDKPFSAKQASQILHRDGLCCANPGCRHKGHLQAHHIVYRSNGGRSVLSNGVAVCRRCHSLIHAGLVTIESQCDQLYWVPRLSTLDVPLDYEPGLAASPLLEAELPAGSPHAATVPSSTSATIASALVNLGYTAGEAKQSVERAIRRLSAGDSDRHRITEAELLATALRA